jgi:hypothetical protein
VTPESLTLVLVYGKHAKWRNLVAYEPGYAIMVNNRGSSVKLAPPALINAISAGLSNPNTKTLSNNDDEDQACRQDAEGQALAVLLRHPADRPLPR